MNRATAYLALLAFVGPGCLLTTRLNDLSAGGGEGDADAGALDTGLDAARGDGDGSPSDAVSPSANAMDAMDAMDAACSPDLGVDSKNCGRCGHDCQGGACAGGMCQAFAIATGQQAPLGMAVDATYVYWANSSSGDIRRCNRSNCVPTTLFVNQLSAEALALFGANIYWTRNLTSGFVGAGPRDGDSGGITVATTTSPKNLAFDQTSAYWTGNVSNEIAKAVLTGGAPTQLVNGQIRAFGLALDALGIVFTDSTGLWTCSTGTCSGAQRIWDSGTVGDATNLVLRGGSIFWIAGANIYTCPRAACGTPTTLVTGQTPLGLAVDDTDVYFTNYASQGTIGKCAIAGCNGSPTTLARNQAFPFAVAVDDEGSVFFTSSGDGNVMKIVK